VARSFDSVTESSVSFRHLLPLYIRQDDVVNRGQRGQRPRAQRSELAHDPPTCLLALSAETNVDDAKDVNDEVRNPNGATQLSGWRGLQPKLARARQRAAAAEPDAGLESGIRSPGPWPLVVILAIAGTGSLWHARRFRTNDESSEESVWPSVVTGTVCLVVAGGITLATIRTSRDD
jgi:hypothetical protein